MKPILEITENDFEVIHVLLKERIYQLQCNLEIKNKLLDMLPSRNSTYRNSIIERIKEYSSQLSIFEDLEKRLFD